MLFDRPRIAGGSGASCPMDGGCRCVAADDCAVAGFPVAREPEPQAPQSEAELRLRRLAEMAPGAFYTCLQTPDGKLRLRRMIEDVFATGEPSSAELCACLPDGASLWLDVRVCAELDGDGGVESVFAIGRDISESVALREKIRAQAFTDPLTRLANRQALYERGPALLREAAARRHRLAVMLLDFDRFKEVNDTMGHGAGDRLLHEVAQRIGACVRGHDLLVRMGGDEFAALVTTVGDDAEVAAVATRVCEALALPLRVGGRILLVTSSIGIAMFPDDGVDLEQLLANADGAMYQAKRAGRNRFEFHCPAFTERA